MTLSNSTPKTKLLSAPFFPQANSSNSISPILSPMGTCLKVRPYPAMKVGDTVMLCVTFFDRATAGQPIPEADFVQTQLVMRQNMKLGLYFFVPKEHLHAVGYGRAEAHYRVIQGKRERCSCTKCVVVDMRSHRLCPPLGAA
jgi:hypothetical protein